MKDRQASIILFFSSLYLAGLLINPLFAAEKNKAQSEDADNLPAGVVVRPKEQFDARGLRDPFKDYFEESADDAGQSDVAREPEIPLPVLTVQGVISGGRLNQAIINNKVVKVGDTIQDVLITNIDKGGITVFFNNKSFNIASPAVNTIQNLEKKPEGGDDEK